MKYSHMFCHLYRQWRPPPRAARARSFSYNKALEMGIGTKLNLWDEPYKL